MSEAEQTPESSAWDELRRLSDAAEDVAVTVTGSNAGGLLADFRGVQCFVPLSQIISETFAHVSADEPIERMLAIMIGRTLHVRVTEVNERRSRVILSERAARA